MNVVNINESFCNHGFIFFLLYNFSRGVATVTTDVSLIHSEARHAMEKPTLPQSMIACILTMHAKLIS